MANARPQDNAKLFIVGVPSLNQGLKLARPWSLLAQGAQAVIILERDE
jgi:hypothetical protein